jgi:hypothetical protein
MSFSKKLFPAILAGFAVCSSHAEALVSLTGEPRPIPAYFLGYNGNLARGGSWRDAALLSAFSSLHPGHLRYPAGTIANYWDWRAGWFKTGAEAPYGLGKATPNPYRLEDLKRACVACGAEPQIVLNLLTSTLDEQIEMLRAARDLGLTVSRVELGNEFYLEKEDYKACFPTAEDYGRVANEWIVAIKREFPKMKVGVVGAAVRAQDGVRRRTWNPRLLPTLKGADALVLHIYQGAGLATRVDETMEATGLVKESDSRVSRTEQHAMKTKFESPAGVARVLGMAFRRWQELPELKEIPRGMEVWVTEYNLFDRTGPVRGTWAHGLDSAVLTLNFLQDARITLATHHSLYGNAMFSAIIQGENAFAGLTENKTATPYALTASGRTLALLGEALRGGVSAQRLAFPFNPEIFVPRLNPYPSLVGWKFNRGSVAKYFILNLSAKVITLPPGGAMPTAGKFTQISGDPHALVTGPSALTVATRDLSRDVGLKLPPYSCTLVHASHVQP